MLIVKASSALAALRAAQLVKQDSNAAATALMKSRALPVISRLLAPKAAPAVPVERTVLSRARTAQCVRLVTNVMLTNQGKPSVLPAPTLLQGRTRA